MWFGAMWLWGGVSLFTLDRPLSEKDKAGGLTVIDVDEEDELCNDEEENVVVIRDVPEGPAASEGESTHLDRGHDEKRGKESEETSRRAGQPVENLDEIGGAWQLLNEVPHDFPTNQHRLRAVSLNGGDVGRRWARFG